METQYDNQTVVGVFSDYNTAREAASQLATLGIPASAIDIHSDRKTGAAGYGTALDTDYRQTTDNRGAGHEGGIAGWFKRTFGDGDSDDTRHYSEAISTGRAVLTATVPAGKTDDAVDILNRYGSAEARSETDARSEDVRMGTPVANRETEHIPVIEEELDLGKRVVRRGGVRVYSRVVEQPVSEQINLREEHARVERRTVDRELTPEEAGNLRDQTIEVTEMAEEPVVGKRTRVREEVRVGKEATERTETVSDTVRRTEVRVEDLNDDTTDRPVADVTRSRV